MSSRGEIQRRQERLREDRQKLRTETLEVEARRRAIDRERAEALVWLRLLCERYGDASWDDGLPLAQILERHLAEPLERTLDRVTARYEELQRRLARAEGALAQATSRTSPAAALPPTPLRSAAGHRAGAVKAELRGLAGYRAVCECGWASALTTSEDAAALDAARHAERFSLDREARGS